MLHILAGQTAHAGLGFKGSVSGWSQCCKMSLLYLKISANGGFHVRETDFSKSQLSA